MMFIPRRCAAAFVPFAGFAAARCLLAAARCLLAAAACLLAAGGCQWVPQGKFEAVQRQNRMLLEQQKAQLAEIENLKIHSHTIEDRLIQTEEDLARRDDQQQRDRKMAAAGQNGFRALRGSALPPGLSDRLAELAHRYPAFQFDAQSGASRVETEVLFDSGKADLRPETKQMLADLAEVFRCEEARELKIMVVGHTDSQNIRGRELRQQYPNNWRLSAGRALGVADYLRSMGIPEERMGVAGFGQFQPVSANDTASARQRNRRVEIYLLGPETPIVGWADSRGGVYR
jgi:chemotaxis protein MotB